MTREVKKRLGMTTACQIMYFSSYFYSNMNSEHVYDSPVTWSGLCRTIIETSGRKLEYEMPQGMCTLSTVCFSAEVKSRDSNNTS